MIGRLILRKDDLWSFKVEDQLRQENNIKEAKEMLEEVESKTYEEVFEEKEMDPRMRRENGEEETKSNASENLRAIEEQKKRQRLAEIKAKVERARKITQKIRGWKLGLDEDLGEEKDNEGEDEESEYDILMDLDDFKGAGGVNM
jgi:replicative superfamily II helicase